MSSKTPADASQNGAAAEKSYFEQQRDLLMRDIGAGVENVLQNLNKLNRSLEGVISVGNEFSSVEALWSHFEDVMAKEEPVEQEQSANAEGAKDGGAN